MGGKSSHVGGLRAGQTQAPGVCTESSKRIPGQGFGRCSALPADFDAVAYKAWLDSLAAEEAARRDEEDALIVARFGGVGTTEILLAYAA